MHNIIIKALITEKTMREAEKNKFTFVVAMTADKPSIRQAVQAQFGVDIINIFTSISKGRVKHIGKRREKVKAAIYKKAIVQLKAGQKIGLFELGA